MDPNSLRTLNDIFFLAVDRKRVCVASYKQSEKWVSISSHELYRYVVGVSYALREWGIGKGDRVAILSENRPEWAMTDFACLALGVVDVPVYPTLTAEQTAYILRDAGARVAFCSTADQVKKLQSIQADTSVERIVVSGGIEIEQPNRRATGERLVYTAGDGVFALTGTAATPPRVVDQARGTVTGAELRFRTQDESVVISNGDTSSSGQRVHTETRVKRDR